jgi:hypothetical protein
MFSGVNIASDANAGVTALDFPASLAAQTYATYLQDSSCAGNVTLRMERSCSMSLWHKATSDQFGGPCQAAAFVAESFRLQAEILLGQFGGHGAEQLQPPILKR